VDAAGEHCLSTYSAPAVEASFVAAFGQRSNGDGRDIPHLNDAHPRAAQVAHQVTGFRPLR
jgi:hypothetical protein